MKIKKPKSVVRKSRNGHEAVKKPPTIPHGQAKGPNAKPTKAKHPMKQKPTS